MNDHITAWMVAFAGRLETLGHTPEEIAALSAEVRSRVEGYEHDLPDPVSIADEVSLATRPG